MTESEQMFYDDWQNAMLKINRLEEACGAAIDAIHQEKVLQASRGESVHVQLGIVQNRLMNLLHRDISK